MICNYCNNNTFFYTQSKCCNKIICNKCDLIGNNDLCYYCGNDKFSKYYNTELYKQSINPSLNNK